MPLSRSVLPLGVLAALVAGALTLDVGPGEAHPATVSSYDDRDLAHAGRWRRLRSHGATLSRSRAPGATLTAPAPTASGGTLTVEAGPGRGSVVVRVGGVVAAKVATAAARVRTRTVPFLGRGTVEVSVRRPGHAGVYVDALALATALTPSISPSVSPSVSPSTSPSAGPSASPPPPPPTGLAFTEVMPDPGAALDSDGEWIELLNTDTTTAELAGCSLTGRSGGSSRLAALRVAPGASIALARTRAPATNGGVPAVGTFSVSLPNESGSVSLTCSGTGIDTLSWDTSTTGVARQLDATGRWCGATELYNAEDRGTPGRANDRCAGPG